MTADGGRPQVAYIMSRFPKLSETFVLEEVRAVEEAGADVILFPLIRERGSVPVTGADEYVRRARYQPSFSPRLLLSALAWAAERPVRLASTLVLAFAGVLGSRKFTLGLIGLLPKTLHNARVARSLGIDHIHAHFAHHPALSAWIIHRLTAIPYSFTAHGHDVQVDRRMLCRKVEDAAFVVTIAAHNRDLMAATCPANAHRIEVLHTGVDVDRLAPRPLRTGADPEEPRAGTRILSVGRLEEVKGHAYLIDAARRALDAGTELELSIVGEGPLRAALEELIARHDLHGRVHLLGPRPHDDVVDLIRGADLFVLPSAPTSDGRVEGIPVVLMEAMALGTPVAASRLPGVVELLGPDHPLLFEPGDADGIAAALARVAHDDVLADALARSGRELVIESFDIRLTAEALVKRFSASSASPPAGDPIG